MCDCSFIHFLFCIYIEKKVLHFCFFFFVFFCLLASPSNQMSDNSLHTKKKLSCLLFFCFAALVTKRKEKISNCLKIFVCVKICHFLSLICIVLIDCRPIIWCLSLKKKKKKKRKKREIIIFFFFFFFFFLQN